MSLGGKSVSSGAKAKDFKGTFIKLGKYLSKYKLKLFLVVLFAILSTIFNIVGPKILGQATTKIYEGVMSTFVGGSGIDFEAIAQILLSLLFIYILSSIFAYIQGFIMSGVSMKTTYNLRKEISEKINRIPLSYFDTTSRGDVLSRITNDVDTLNQSLNQSASQLVTSITTIIGIFVMMISISWEMSLVAFCIIPIALFIISKIVKHSQKHFADQQEYLGKVNGHIEEMYSGHIIMKAFNGESASIKKFDEYNKILYNSAWKSQFLSGINMPVMTFISNIGYVAICILGGYLVITQGLPVGDIQAFIQYVRQFTQPLNQIATISNMLQQTAASAERVFEFLAVEEEIPEASNPLIINTNNNEDNQNKINVKGSIEFDHVNFGYTKNKTIINDFSAKVKPGQSIAIVGPTGAGKTTMVKLLMRFYDVTGGAILVEGHNIKDFSRNSLRSAFGMVLQETWLYSASIKDNIRYGKLNATDEEVFKAAKAAQVDHFISTLPGGYDMILNEDADNVSQGQKQLLTIARAIIADPKILILDEATSSVDTKTEILIQKALDNLMKGRTSFVIAHRLSTIRDADLILVMKDGDIIEQGTHNELMSKNGFYTNLYNSQFAH